MFVSRRRIRDELVHTTSALLARIQRLEDEHTKIHARLEGERQLRIYIAQVAAAARVAPLLGVAMERFAQAMRAPLPVVQRGRAGGLARAKTAWRYFDGTFMPESEKAEAYREEHERYAAGGRARARCALRNWDGTFLSKGGG